MKKRTSLFLAFGLLILISAGFIFLSKSKALNSFEGLAGVAGSPLEKITFGIFSSHVTSNDALKNENMALVSKLSNMQNLVQENQALRDQFETSYPKSQNLLPAEVVSAPSFVPGVSSPEYLIINKGTKDGVKMGSAVVFKDNLLGKVSKSYSYLSKVTLISNASSSFQATTVPINTNEKPALGVIRGAGGEEMILDNVLLADSLKVGDYVVTKGDLNTDGTGYPPSLTVGKIESVEKRASDLFQKAQVRSLVDFSRLRMVFVVASR